MSKRRFPIHMKVELESSLAPNLVRVDEREYERAIEIIKRQIGAELGWKVWATIVFPKEE